MRGVGAMVISLVFLLAASPTTTPALDQSTPKGALKLFARALDAGDRQRILTLLQADNEQEKKLAAATADLAEATAKLRDAASKTFGAEKSRALGVDATGTADALKRIDGAAETVTGDRASMRTPDADGPPLTLVKRDGVWRVPVSELSKDVQQADIEKNLADLNRQTVLMRELALEVAAQKYASAMEARQALDKRILSSSLPPISTTAPAGATTRP